MNKRVLLIILDGVGVGAMEDAYLYGDENANTLKNTLSETGVKIPNLTSLGLLKTINNLNEPVNPLAAYGKMKLKSAGKDTTTGHFELMGLIREKPAPTFSDGFPADLIKEFEKRIGRKTIGNKPSSGIEIIKELGKMHMETGYPIVYTSADSVFQIAAHEEIVNLNELYRICEIARQLLRGDWEVERVIARPFIGESPNFIRTPSRRDFNLPPSKFTVLDLLQQHSIPVWVIGKIGDIFSLRGISQEIRTKYNKDGMNKILLSLSKLKKGLIFTNLNDFDTLFGHRRSPRQFSESLKEFDDFLPLLLGKLTKDDLLIITADHGCDPTYIRHTDHTREKVPLLVYSLALKKKLYLGERESLSDVGQTILEYFQIPGNSVAGKSFLPELSM
ncbi:MAG: Phosphopentomutase [candidate division WS2 bacterium]|nr:Phosphopentomutase [Candidatus Psychracetigena formicireducens]